MNFAVIGSGGREHSICFKLKQSPKIKRLICIPGNAGTREIAENSSETHIAVFIHGRLIRILLSEILGLGLKNMHQIQHQNGAINHLIWENGVFKTVQLNIVNHLHHLKKTV